MNKKAFTLIEVMATVIIISIIAVISYPTLSNMLRNSSDVKLKSFKENAELAADSYLRVHNSDKLDISSAVSTSGVSSYSLGEVEYTEIPVEVLIKEEFLDKPNFDYNYKYDSIICSKTCEYGQTDISYGTKYTIHNEEYMAIRNSFNTQDYVVLMKVRGLSVNDLNTYGSGNINKYTKDNKGVPAIFLYDDSYQSGGVAYYSSSTCGYVDNTWIESDCKVSYNDSDVKKIIDNWSSVVFSSNELKNINGYSARLVTMSELKPKSVSCSSSSLIGTDLETNYGYWIMPNDEDHVLSSSKDKSGACVNAKSLINISDGHQGNIQWTGGELVDTTASYEYEVKPVINYSKEKLKEL